MINDTEFQQFSVKLFRYLDRRFGDIEDRLDQKAEKVQVDSVQNSIDALYGKVENLEVEYYAVKKQLDRHEHWIDYAAKK